jgi:hypothetical protein
LLRQSGTIFVELFYNSVKVLDCVSTAFRDDFAGTPFAFRRREPSDSGNRTNLCSPVAPFILARDILPPDSDLLNFPIRRREIACRAVFNNQPFLLVGA